MIAVSICICTFQRPAGLLRLLRSLARLAPGTPPHEIIVVDNDAAGSGAPAVAQARAAGMRITYAVEPVRGIARARNRSVAPARGAFVAFIDDDEEADPHWLMHLYDEVRRAGVDGGIGPVLPCLPAGTPHWLVTGGFFDRPRPATGTVLAAGGMRTGNALIRRTQLLALPGPFDECYALSGSEDTDMFARLVRAGTTMIAVDSAIVHEHLTPQRARMRYLLRRRFYAGANSARMYRATQADISRAREGLRWLASGLRLGVTGLVLLPAGRTRAMTRLSLAARDLGRWAHYSGFSFQPYADDTFR